MYVAVLIFTVKWSCHVYSIYSPTSFCSSRCCFSSDRHENHT